MPRNGQGVYSLPPVYLAVTGEKVQAQQHNTPLEDLAADANLPRPITTGGTGGGSAKQARDNLDVYSKPEVDTKIRTTVSEAPKKDAIADEDGVLVTDSTDSDKPKRVLWSKITETLKTKFDALYLKLSGGTLTGALTLSGDPTEKLHAAPKQYIDGKVDNLPSLLDKKLNLSGGQMTGTINGAAATAAGLSSFFANTHGGSFDGMRTRGAPFTSWVNHSGSSYAPVVKISYNSANAYVGHWSVGVLNGQDVNANTFCISHVNADGHLGRSWFFNPISGDLEIPAALKMTRGAFYDDGNSGGAKWEAWGSWYAFEAINNRIEQRARDWAVQEGNWQTRTYLLAERFPIGSTLLARVNHTDLPSGTWVGGDQIEMVYFSDGNGTPMRMNSSNGPGWGSWEALSHISRYHAGNFKRVQ